MNMMKLMDIALASVLVLLASAPWYVYSQERLLVRRTLVRNAPALGAFCLDGSLPAYHLNRGFGNGANNWILYFEGGGWCGDIKSCLDRAKTSHGSTNYMNKWAIFSGILSNNASLNPDFYNWNRVKLRYCDGASFAGDGKFTNGTSLLYFRGQKIWEAIVLDLLPRGLANAHKALLAGCSAGGLATFLHCDNFTRMLPNASVKCLSDAGFFLDERDVSFNHTIRFIFEDIVSLQGVEQNLDHRCTKSMDHHKLCFFPHYALKYITTPFFVLNSAYDVIQFHHILVPPFADAEGKWNHCKHDPAACNADQIAVLQGFRRDMLKALSSFLKDSQRGGTFINSCFAHCQSDAQESWFSVDSPRIHNKTVAEAVGDWYFSRRETKEIDCEYPCDTTCHNLIPLPQVSWMIHNKSKKTITSFHALKKLKLLVSDCAKCGSVGNKTLTSSQTGSYDRFGFKYSLSLISVVWLLS